jgi:hypothetical protein
MGWIPAAIGGAASLGGAAMGGKGAKAAAQSQERSSAAALDFAKEQERTRQANFQRAYDIWDRSRQALLDKYGIVLPAGSAPQPGGAPGGPAAPRGGVALAPAQMASAAPAGAVPQNASLAELLGDKGNLGTWNDWSKISV